MKIRVQEVPKAKSSKLIETNRIAELRGIVRRAGECRHARQSGGTQYINPPSESLTQPFGSGSTQKSACVDRKSTRLNSSHVD